MPGTILNYTIDFFTIVAVWSFIIPGGTELWLVRDATLSQHALSQYTFTGWGKPHSSLDTLIPSTRGITPVRDTSFTTSNAFNSTVIKYPFITIAEVNSSREVNEQYAVTYCQREKRSLAMDIFSPANKKNANKIAVFIIHGGGWRSGDRSQHYPLARALVKKGYTCFTPEYRLSTESLYPAAIWDLKSALQFVREHAAVYEIDPNKISTLGFSAGGELAAFMAATPGIGRFINPDCNITGVSDEVNAVVTLDGILSFVHPESGEGDDSKKISAATQWFGFGKYENPFLWADASPLSHAENVTAPFLFINSSVERMHAGRNDFIKILTAHNVYTNVKTFADAPHNFPLFNPWFQPTVEYIHIFLKNVFSKKAG